MFSSSFRGLASKREVFSHINSVKELLSLSLLSALFLFMQYEEQKLVAVSVQIILVVDVCAKKTHEDTIHSLGLKGQRFGG